MSLTVSKRKVYVVGNDNLICNMFRVHMYEVVRSEEAADIVCFTGGEDISPFLYGEYPLFRNGKQITNFNASRDMMEIREYHKIKFSKLKVGICRGGQFLNVMSGGKMWQDVDGHTIGTSHEMCIKATKKDGDDIFIPVTSTHHQMMIPGEHADILATARESKRKESMLANEKIENNVWDDPEVIYYWHTNSLCFQPHPEYNGVKECTEYFFELLSQYDCHNIKKEST